MNINLSHGWKSTPGLSAGILCMNSINNTRSCPALEALSEYLEAELREKYEGFDRPQLRQQPALDAYHRYYKRFRKSYHVQLQLESVALHDKPIQSPSPLVLSMFMAELKYHLLTSGHDLDRASPPLTIAEADGSECYLRINNQDQTLKPHDLYIQDEEAILSSIIYGPDYRTRIQPHTTRVLYTVYGVEGIHPAAIQTQLEYLRDLILTCSPSAEVENLDVIESDEGI